MLSFPVLVKKLWRYGYGALGSLYYQGSDGVEVELPIGPEGNALKVVGGVPAWTTGDNEILQDGTGFTGETDEILYDGTGYTGATGAILEEAGVTGTTPVLVLDDLTDVDVPTPADGDVLTWVDADGMWEAVAPVTGGGGDTQDAADGTFYVATTGSNITGDGSIGNPWATVTFALSTLPRSIGFVQIIVIADGTYAESINVVGFTCTGSGLLKFQGNTTTPANVTFTGTTAITCRGLSETVIAHVQGPARVEFEGIRVNGTATHGFLGREGCHVYLDRVVTAGTLTYGVSGLMSARVEFQGNITVAGFSDFGVRLSYGTVAAITSAGTLTVTGSGSIDGIHISWNSHLAVSLSGCNLAVSGVTQGFNMGLQSSFGHIAGTANISITNSATPGSSAAIMCTDHTTWASNGGASLTANHYTNLFRLNSLSYGEHKGTRTLSSISSPGAATQNSIILLA